LFRVKELDITPPEHQETIQEWANDLIKHGSRKTVQALKHDFPEGSGSYQLSFLQRQVEDGEIHSAVKEFLLDVDKSTEIYTFVNSLFAKLMSVPPRSDYLLLAIDLLSHENAYSFF
jgi:hypothetical protein